MTAARNSILWLGLWSLVLGAHATSSLADEAQDAVDLLSYSLKCAIPLERIPTSGKRYFFGRTENKFSGTKSLLRIEETYSAITSDFRAENDAGASIEEANFAELETSEILPSLKGDASHLAPEVGIYCRGAKRCIKSSSGERSSSINITVCDGDTATDVKRAVDTLIRLSSATPTENANSTAALSFTILENTDLSGTDFWDKKGISLAQCETTCKEQPKCQAYSYVEPKRWCWLKSEAGARLGKLGTTSGLKHER